MRKKQVRWWWIVLAIVLMLSAALVVWIQPMTAGESTLEILRAEPVEGMTITDDGSILTFCPLEPTTAQAVIFYPGARVDYRAYTPTLSQITQAGVPVVVMRMPLNFAFLALNRADEIINEGAFVCENEITDWYLGGHSLGGAMAAQYAADHQDEVTGLILWGSYPGSNLDLTDASLRVLSIYGSEDGGVEEIRSSQSRLPLDAVVHEISGGNHAQFGDYGIQAGDGEAVISPTEQWDIVAEQTLSFLQTFSEE